MAHGHDAHPPQAVGEQAQRIAAVDLLRPESRPGLHQTLDAGLEIIGMAGQTSAVDGTRGGAGDHREGIARQAG
jgi:hypothetical protein